MDQYTQSIKSSFNNLVPKTNFINIDLFVLYFPTTNLNLNKILNNTIPNIMTHIFYDKFADANERIYT